MLLLVLLEVRALAESAAALGTCVGLLAGVRVLVLQQEQAALKDLLAQRARVLLGAGVCTLVLAQLERWLKALLHSGHAYGFSPATGTPWPQSPQGRRPNRKDLWARARPRRWRSAMCLLVAVEVGAAHEGLATLCALVWPLSLVDALVLQQARGARESLADLSHTYSPWAGGALGQEPEAKPHGTSPICCCSWGLRSSSATCPWSWRASAALHAKGLTTWACARQPH